MKENKEQKEYKEVVTVRKGNAVMRAKYKGSLLENQLIAIGSAKLPYDGSGYDVYIYPEELQMLIKKQDNHGIYSRLKVAADRLTSGYSIFAEDKRGNFGYYVLIKTAEYKDGVFHIAFNDDLNKSGFLGALKSNYTAYPLANVMNFESTYSFRMYEIIRSYAWRCRGNEPAIVRFDIDELKCMMGIVDVNDNVVRKFIKNQQWSEAVSAAKNKSYDRWDAFKRYVLDKARDEIREKCDVYFSYVPVKDKGRKYKSLIISIYKNSRYPDELKKELKVVESVFNNESPGFYVEGLPDMLKKYIGHNRLTENEMDSFYLDADKNPNIVEEAILAADEKSNEPGYVIDNYPGWIRTYIRNGGYKEQVVTMGSAERGDQLVQMKNDMEKISSDKELSADFSAKYWNRVKENNHDKFKEFVTYLGLNNMTLQMFEIIHSPAECGDIFIDFVKTGNPHLI